MPRYKVNSPGFHDGVLYHPEGKRKTLVVDKAFKKCPSWLTPIKEESAAQRKKREAAEVKQAEVEAEKREQDRKDVDAVTFTQPPSISQTETL